MLVYWSGAALALQTDVELRRRSNGVDSLDRVLARMAQCCLPGEKIWSAGELMRRLDEHTEFPVFVELYREIAFKPGMPDQQSLYRQLGIEPIPGGGKRDSVTLDDAAPLATIRRAIMKPLSSATQTAATERLRSPSGP